MVEWYHSRGMFRELWGTRNANQERVGHPPHALEHMTGGDASQHRAIEIENQLRDEQHLPERAQDR